MLPVIKANGYGHGSVRSAQTLLDCGAKRLAVATFEEAVELRSGGISADVFVLNGVMGPLAEYARLALIPVLHQMEELGACTDFTAEQGSPLAVALKFDTGMGRLGFPLDTVGGVIAKLRSSPRLDLRCVMTHLARADESIEFTFAPYRRFHGVREAFRTAGFADARFSICNSASIIDRHFDDYAWVRPGIALYGAYPNPRQIPLLDLQPVLELKTRVIELKRLAQGLSIGYGGTFTSARETALALLPIGYADGYPRLISNRGQVLIRGKRAPIIGRISMDLMAVDASAIPGVTVYDDVTLIGTDGDETLRVEEVAGWANTISYEILTGMMPRVRREYTE